MQLDILTLFAEDTPASLSVMPGSAEARKMTATSGQKCIGSWLPSGPLGACLRMLLVTSAWASTKCYLTWKTKATPANRLLFQLAPQMPNTAGTEYGFWPTPDVRGFTNDGGLEMLKKKVSSRKEWSGMGFRKGASAKERLWPTPGAADNRDRGHIGMPAIQRRQAKGKQLNLSMVVSDVSGALNPTWVEWLMGFPEGWTDLNASETPSCLKSRK
jgi:hypothetical protein